MCVRIPGVCVCECVYAHLLLELNYSLMESIRKLLLHLTVVIAVVVAIVVVITALIATCTALDTLGNSQELVLSAFRLESGQKRRVGRANL